MFEKQLEKQLMKIFNVSKVTYNEPSESNEQECLFVEVEKSRNRITDKKQHARVTGTLNMYGSAQKMPFGFFSKMIDAAAAEDLKGFAFFDFERNSRTFVNIVQRTVSFTYFFDEQFNPNVGDITSVTTTIIEV